MFEPSWLLKLKSKLGEREIPGPKHNSWIASGWAKLGAAWFNSDETPWCGFAVAWAFNEVHVALPKNWPQARAWATWGVGRPMSQCGPGTVLVFAREGGGHVGFYVAEDAVCFHVLGGNQGNAVSIARIAKQRCIAARWPAGIPFTGKPVIVTADGVPVSTNEA